MLKLGIVGICGRMGHAILECCQGLEGVKVVCGIDKIDDSKLTNFQGEIKDKVEDLSIVPDVLVDFSRPDCTMSLLDYAVKNKVKLVIGTTGFDAKQKETIVKAASKTAIVQAANFSVGINVLLNLIEKTSAIMADADIEIVEAHHRYKVDAPSGTALAMGEAAATGRGVHLSDVMVAGRNGVTGERQYGTIGFSSIRGGDIVGEHHAMFCCDGERIDLSHFASSRLNFARGAIRAVIWINDKTSGFYAMSDVLGLTK